MQRDSVQRANFRFWTSLDTRWADCDPYGHVNNAQYYSYFDTALTRMLIERGVLRSADDSSIGLCVESQCCFFAPIKFPATVDIGVAIGKMGDKSLRYEIGIFELNSDKPLASGYFVHVFVDPATRRTKSLSDRQRAAIFDIIL